MPRGRSCCSLAASPPARPVYEPAYRFEMPRPLDAAARQCLAAVRSAARRLPRRRRGRSSPPATTARDPGPGPVPEQRPDRLSDLPARLRARGPDLRLRRSASASAAGPRRSSCARPTTGAASPAAAGPWSRSGAASRTAPPDATTARPCAGSQPSTAPSALVSQSSSVGERSSARNCSSSDSPARPTSSRICGSHGSRAPAEPQEEPGDGEDREMAERRPATSTEPSRARQIVGEPQQRAVAHALGHQQQARSRRPPATSQRRARCARWSTPRQNSQQPAASSHGPGDLQARRDRAEPAAARPAPAARRLAHPQLARGVAQPDRELDLRARRSGT